MVVNVSPWSKEWETTDLKVGAGFWAERSSLKTLLGDVGVFLGNHSPLRNMNGCGQTVRNPLEIAGMVPCTGLSSYPRGVEKLLVASRHSD